MYIYLSIYIYSRCQKGCPYQKYIDVHKYQSRVF